MSHWAEVQTMIKDMACLKETLTEMGYTYQEGKHEINDYSTSKRVVDLSVINRIGFIQGKETINIVADWYNLPNGIKEKSFMTNLKQIYAKKTIEKSIGSRGFRISNSKKLENGNLQVVVQRWT